MQYYDEVLGRFRFKSRYVWAGWALLGGVILGFGLGVVFEPLF